jgi:TonB family protein
MGLWEFLRQWPRGRLVVGVAVSIVAHALLTWGVLWGLVGVKPPRWAPKPGDTLIVELPRPEESGRAGTPSAPSPPPPAPPPPRASAPAASKSPAPPRPAPAPPREAPRVASAPRPAEPPPLPAPRAAEPAPPAAEPTPPVAEPAPRAPESTPPVAEPAPRVAEPASPSAEPPARAVAPPPAPRPEPAPRVPAPGGGRGGEREVAALPPSAPPLPSASDVRAALRRGAGGHGQGRGGIEGDPIPLDSTDLRYSDYLDQVRRRIKEKWGFPCVPNPVTRGCDHHTTSLEVEFGILKDGRLQFVDLVRSADYPVYDEYAMNAIRLAQPFPPVPAALMAQVRAGSTGIPIRARFSYVVESSLTNLLR